MPQRPAYAANARSLMHPQLESIRPTMPTPVLAAMPIVFVMLWSTGFIGSKLGAPFAEPMVFLSLRFAAALPLLALIGWKLNTKWPSQPSLIAHCILTGALVHGIYLGGVFWAIKNGLPAGVSAIVVGLQPMLSVILAAAILKDPIRKRHILGLGLGLAGLVLVLGLGTDLKAQGITSATISSVIAAVAAISLGTVYQKKFVPQTDLISATTWQYVGALAVSLPLAWFEDWTVVWSTDFTFALVWLVLVLSIGATLLLMALIRRGAVSEVASLFYLVPVATSLESYALFGETLSLIQIAGMGLIAFAVILIRRKAVA